MPGSVAREGPWASVVGWWNLVFPIGMYGVATHEAGQEFLPVQVKGRASELRLWT
jgi:hypothetical protein